MSRLLQSALAIGIAGMVAAPPAAALEGWTPALELRVQASSPQGQTTPASGTWKMIKGGEPLAKTVVIGASLCSVGIGGADTPSAQFPVATIWKVNGEYLGEQSGRHAIRVTTRFVRLAGQESTVSATQPLSLREGDTVVLDALTNALDASCPVRTVTIEARLVMVPDDPALADVRYTADLWFVHTGPDGQEQREHLIANVDGSGPMPFLFKRLGFAVPQIDARQGNAAAFIQLSGALRARAREDGAIDLAIDTRRQIFGFEFPGKHAATNMAPVRKTVTVRPDETTAVDFPVANGFIMLRIGDTAAGDGRIAIGARRDTATPTRGTNGPVLEVEKERLVFYPARFFKGHRTQLLIRLRKLQ